MLTGSKAVLVRGYGVNMVKIRENKGLCFRGPIRFAIFEAYDWLVFSGRVSVDRVAQSARVGVKRSQAR